jgi:hypothetical protein
MGGGRQHFGLRTNKAEKRCCRWKENIKIDPKDGRFRFEVFFLSPHKVLLRLILPIKFLREIFYAKIFATFDRKQCRNSMSETKISRKKNDLLLNLSLAFYLPYN